MPVEALAATGVSANTGIGTLSVQLDDAVLAGDAIVVDPVQEVARVRIIVLQDVERVVISPELEHELASIFAASRTNRLDNLAPGRPSDQMLSGALADVIVISNAIGQQLDSGRPLRDTFCAFYIGLKHVAAELQWWAAVVNNISKEFAGTAANLANLIVSITALLAAVAALIAWVAG